MKIDRYNYEEMFILYLDNELSSDQRREVEDFVEKNPDLKDELEILGQYKLTPDNDIVFENINTLFRQEELTTINTGNYQEWMLLYLDNELSFSQKKDFEEFAGNYPSVSKELEELLLTRLKPEAIIFPDKDLLYRRTITTKIISVYWRRVAAAVIFLLLLAAGTLIITGKKSTTKDEIAKTPVEKKETVQPTQAEVKRQDVPELANINSPAKQEPVALKNDNKKEKINGAAYSKNNLNVSRDQKQPIREEQDELIAENKPRTNNLPLPIENSNAKEGLVTNSNVNNNIKEIKTPTFNTNLVTNTSVQPSNIVYASQKEDATLDQTDGKKNKLRGLLRKVTRTFEKNTQVNATDENDRLLIGGLALKLN